MKEKLLEMIQTGAVQNGIAISLIDLLIGLVMATLLALVIVFVYRITHRGLHYERSFLVTLLMTPMIIAVVMMLIGSNLALSLGMVGALSIIRFRTVIKDSRDMVFLFFAIAIGLGCGTYNWQATMVATGFASSILLLLHVLQYGKPMHSDQVLVLSGEGSVPKDSLKKFLRKHVDFLEVRSMDITDGGWQFVFELRFFKEQGLNESTLFEELKTDYGVRKISLLAPQLSLPM